MTKVESAILGRPLDPVGSDWRGKYSRRLAISDFLVLVWVVFGVQIAWLGTDSEAVGVSGSRGEITISYTLISISIIVGWMVVLRYFDTRADRVIGVGSAEYRLVVNSSIRLFGFVAIVAFLFKIDLARGYILMAFPIGVAVLVLSRWMWRQWLGVKRMKGEYSFRVVLVGSAVTVAHLAAQLERQPHAGYKVVAVCVPSREALVLPHGIDIPRYSDVSKLMDVVEGSGADTVVLTSSDELPPDRVRELSWALEPGRQHLVVAPAISGIAGPRIHTRPVAGLPLIHVETPRYEGRKILAKRAFDLIASALLLLVLSPLMLLVSAAIKLASPGPILFVQPRVGIRGEPFRMFKFRTMVVDAETKLADLDTQVQDAGNGVLFKMKDDPRLTSVGKILRRFSLDELPQILNVMRGDMSLVGPRPPLEKEVSVYEQHVHRRFLVKPGITGLWQVSGRSNLSWEDTVRLDLYYVENWSFIGDLVILWKTFRAVVSREGAY